MKRYVLLISLLGISLWPHFCAAEKTIDIFSEKRKSYADFLLKNSTKFSYHPFSKSLADFKKALRGPRGRRGRQGATGPAGPAGPAATVAALGYTIYVDSQHTTSIQNGSIQNPFRTIQAALDSIPSATSSSEMQSIYTILIAGGIYDEDLSITLDGKRIALVAMGPVTLGKMNGSGWQNGGIDGTIRNITITQTSQSSDFGSGIQNGFSINSFQSTSHSMLSPQSYCTKFRISGDLTITQWSTAVPINISLNCEIFGNLAVAAVGGAAPQNFTFYYSHIHGQVLADLSSSYLQVAMSTLFEGGGAPPNYSVIMAAYYYIHNCDFRNGMQIDGNLMPSITATNGATPIGIYQTRFQGEFNSNSVTNSLRLDDQTNFWFKAAGGSIGSFVGPSGVRLIIQ
jgi:hypothetical protein